jgi:programmed cell death protein 5
VSEDELEELRRRKLLALQQKFAEEQRQAQMEQQLELQKQTLLRKILTPEARQRLTNLKIVATNPAGSARKTAYTLSRCAAKANTHPTAIPKA